MPLQAMDRFVPELEGPHGITLDRLRRVARAGDRPLELTKLEFDLLTVFLLHPGQVLETRELLEMLWGYEEIDRSAAGNLRTAVYRLRGTLEKTGIPNFIKAVPGVGYALEHPDRGDASSALSRAGLEMVLRLGSVPLLVVGEDASIILANPAVAELTGLPVVELERAPSWLVVLESDSWQSASATLWSLNAEDGWVSTTVRIRGARRATATLKMTRFISSSQSLVLVNLIQPP